MMLGMKATIDAEGRLLIPEEIRDQAGLEPGTEVNIRFEDGHVEIEPKRATVRLVREGHALVAVFPDTTEQLPEDIVDRIREEIERERAGF
jgi:AbrB family looped-hinge helix DNA binding protein